MRRRSSACLAVGVLALLAGCHAAHERREIRTQRLALEREVEGLRRMAAGMKGGESLVPREDIAIAIDDRLVRDLITAQLPFSTDVQRFHASLTDAEVEFRGVPAVQLRGTVRSRDNPALEGTLRAQGALENIALDRNRGTMSGKVALDAVTIEEARGLETLLSPDALARLGEEIRARIVGLLPPVEIPVRVQQGLELPAVDSGPVRIAAATLPLRVGISRLYAARGRLWIGVSVHPGAVVRGANARPASATPEAGR